LVELWSKALPYERETETLRTRLSAAGGEIRMLRTERNAARGERDAIVATGRESALSAIQRLPHYSRYNTTRSVELDVDNPTRWLLVSEFQRTIVQHRRKHTLPHCPAPELEVDSVEQLFIPRLQDKYIAEVNDLAGLCERKVAPVQVDALPVQTFEGLPLSE
jgi:hypothetical protein